MLQAAIELQKAAVKKLINLTTTQDEITFKSPTGSGKTYMMANMMNSILEQFEDVIFLVSTLSKGSLATQNYEKFMEYSAKGDFKSLRPYLISSEVAAEERLFVPIDYNVYILPRDLYKKGGKLMQGAMESFLHSIILPKCFSETMKRVFLIKDECHIATNNLDSLSDRYFTKTYNFSATPKLSRGQHPDVEITSAEAVSAKLIKNVEIIDDPNVAVGDVVTKFQEIREQYRNLLGVNPCLIIQISNKDKADEELQKIYNALNKENVLKWMLIVNNDKECDTNDDLKKLPINKWKDYAKENSSTIDVIIFKMVITEGWDIPRACMLYQIRDSKSKQLDEQVIGRVRRNPRLLDYAMLSEEAQKLAMTAWVWGIVTDDLKKSFGVKLWQDSDIITNEFMVTTTRIKTLSEKPFFDIHDFLSKLPVAIAPSSIFKLYRDFKKAELSVQEIGHDYADDFSRWLNFAENIESIATESTQYICDYTYSMEAADEASFAPSSHYADNGYYTNITDWVWKRNDGKEKFSFDSEAEWKWAEILKDLVKEDNNDGERVGKRLFVGKKNPNAGQPNLQGIEPDFINTAKQIYVWGKNYVPNSAIKFEYYLGTRRFSYPDFVMKDSYGRVHIFEVKSVNISSSMSGNFDNKIYKAKLEELKRAYKQASTLTGHIFYLPILRDDIWRIYQYVNGDEEILSRDSLLHYVKLNVV